MPETYFFTGFPGFIATRLIKQLVQTYDFARFYLLVHPSQLQKAEHTVQRLAQAGFGRAEQYILVPGDITEENLGLEEGMQVRLAEEVQVVFHLAAIYDLAVPEDVAYRVNVLGTGNVSQWVQKLKSLRRYVYFSTAYVSGDRTGRIYETELDANQSFKNFYESTKFAAEQLVQQIRSLVPTTILRPGIVMGDSQTGETVKFDGPYFVMRFLDRFRNFPIPFVGRGEAEINLVPVDYIVAATLYLAHAETGVNKVYHLTDPNPCSAKEAYERICEALLGKTPSWTVPAAWIKGALSIGAFRRFVHVEQETIDYFQCPAVYDNSQAQADLAPAGIRCPDFREYIGREVAYYKQHRADPAKRIVVR